MKSKSDYITRKCNNKTSILADSLIFFFNNYTTLAQPRTIMNLPLPHDLTASFLPYTFLDFNLN